jgi:arylsulfatase
MILWAVMAALMSAANLSAAAADGLAGRRPNIILIMTDDQGYGDLACHGNPILQTPHIDQLHAQSVRFTDFHASPTCAPTRSALMTGKHEFRSGVTHTILERERMSLAATTLPQVLRTAGYTTGIFGKWHLGDEAEYRPDRRGFDETFIHGAGGIGQTYPGSGGDAPGNQYFNPAILHNGRFVKTQGYCTDVFFAEATRWIESQKGRKPFFAYITPNAPHGPLIVAEEYERRYADKVPPNVAKFFGMIANIDDNVGKLVGRLAEWGIERETLVIFMTDNGGTAGCKLFNAGLRGTKGSAWQGGTRVPHFWRWPGTLEPRDIDKLAAHVDLFPTLAALVGAEVPAAAGKLDGRSLLPLLESPSADWPDRRLVTHVGRWPKGADPADHQYDKAAIRNARYSLVFEGPNKATLYDLTTDRGQTTDISADHPQVAAQLREAYDQWWEEVMPSMVNEKAEGPAINPFKEIYWRQFPAERPAETGANP